MNDFEQARRLATHLPDARLVPLQSRNHIVLEEEPAWPVKRLGQRGGPFRHLRFEESRWLGALPPRLAGL
jgi:hypothetical protein